MSQVETPPNPGVPVTKGKAMQKQRARVHNTQVETQRRRQTNRLREAARYHAVEAAQFARAAPNVDADPVECLQEVLDLWLTELSHCQRMVDQIDTRDDGEWRDSIAGRQPHEWIRLRDFYASKLERCSMDMVRNGIVDKAINAQAAYDQLVPSDEKAAEIAAAMKEAGL